jgi:Helix-turn-helix domain
MTTGHGTRLGDALRRYRLAAGLSQEELADRAGTGTRRLSDPERGLRAAPRPETLRMPADALGWGRRPRGADHCGPPGTNRGGIDPGPRPGWHINTPRNRLIDLRSKVADVSCLLISYPVNADRG